MYGVALAVFLVAQSILVIGLLISRRRKIRAATQLQANIAEHVNIESGLRESESRLMMLLDNLNAAIYIKGTDYRYVYANKGTCELLGKRLEEVIGRVDSDLVDATMAARANARIAAVLPMGGASPSPQTPSLQAPSPQTPAQSSCIAGEAP